MVGLIEADRVRLLAAGGMAGSVVPVGGTVCFTCVPEAMYCMG